ncbi:MAG: FAD-dependent oxidoreductase [Clostridiaceae bacterium]|jgi:NADH dehydrogenase|nr:FAD-dependent oxidoreductase [Clostridiaceae bacterium]
MAKKVIIVGAGYAGVEAALTLNKKKKRDEIEIILIDKNPYHTLLTELHEVAGNRISEEGIRIPLKRIFKYTDVKLVMDEITSFDFDNKRISSEKNTYEYDYLITAMGSSPNYFGIPGLEDHTFSLWSFDDAVRIREHIKQCFILASQEKDEEERKRLLTFVVSGAGFTGVEMIGELAIWVKSLCKQNIIDRKDVRLVIIDMLPRILNTLSEKTAAKAHKYLEQKLNVEVMLNTNITAATDHSIIYNGGEIQTRTIIWAAGIKACEDAEECDLERASRQNRIRVDEFCRTENHNVYAIGDLGGLSDEKGIPYAAMVENALQTAEGAAMNILNDIRGKEPEKVKVKFHGTMVSVGNYYCVSEIMGKSLPVWLSLVMKYLVNMHYLWEITGFSGVARYLYHEVLERRQRKIFLEKHWSTRVQAWWLTPLRLFLGGMWLYEGLVKAADGWFSSPKLASFLGMASDATSAASPTAAYVTKIDDVFRIKTGLINFFIETETRIAGGEDIIAQHFARLEFFHFGDFNLVPWFLNNVVLANDGVAMFFQILVVVLEILVGLMLLGGALTFIGSLISLGLVIMFMSSTGLYEKSWWMLFASIATMGGAGRAFGLDYYLLPYLNNVWENFWKNRKFKLFFKGSIDRFD